MDRIPSFFHSYCSVPAVQSFTPVKPKSSKRPRAVSTPTGKTPLRSEKRSFIENVCSDKENSRKRWSDEEKYYLKIYTKENPPGTDNVSVQDYWDNFADYLHKNTGETRSGDSCRRYYTRAKNIFSTSVVEPRTKTVQTQTETKEMHDYSTQSEDAFLTLDHDKVVEMIKKDRILYEKILSQVRADIYAEARAATTLSSVLNSRRTLEEMAIFTWREVVDEMEKKLPLLYCCLEAVLKKSFTDNLNEMHIPKIGLIYGIIMQARYPKLSLVQRIISVSLKDSHAHEKVFDRLSPVGVTTSYSTLTNVLEVIGNNCLLNLVLEVKNGHIYRIIGDNVNFQVGKKYKRSTEKEKELYHWFGSVAVTQVSKFEHLPDVPQGNARDLPNDAFIPTENDKGLLRRCFTNHLSKIAVEFFPYFKKLKPNVKNIIMPEYPDVVRYKNKTLVLPVLPLNEQSYSDVVQILDNYEEIVDQIKEMSGEEIKCVQIGGDQLTRERFSGAKGLRAGSFSSKERFDNLYPITFELFHTAMNFLSLMFKILMNEESLEKGTLNSMKVRLKRSCVHMDVKNHYDDDKDFMLSFVRAHLLKAMLDYFGMKEIDDIPSKNVNVDADQNMHVNFEDFLDRYIFCSNSGDSCAGIQPTVMQQITLPNGMTFLIPLFSKCDVHLPSDGIYDYGIVVMELGLIFIEFIDVFQNSRQTKVAICTEIHDDDF